MKTIQEIKTDFEQAIAEIPAIQGLNTSDRVNIAIALLREYGKYNRGEAMSTAKANGNGNNDKPISEKQIKFLQDLGVTELPKTSREASALIEQVKGSNAKGSNYSNGKGGFSARSLK